MRAPDFWAPGHGGLTAALLAPLGAAYGLISARRARRAPAYRAPVPVICVGNAVMGGAGKTPVVLDLLSRLARIGRTPHALIRGYGGDADGPLRVDPARHTHVEVGDEALLLARRAPTWVGADRAAGAQGAVAAGADVLVMDDGFQNPALAKTVSLLVVDAAYGFGNGRVFPAGPLREPARSALARASAVVVIGADKDRCPAFHELPVFRANIVADGSATALRGRRVVAVAGIARPDKFFRTLRDLGAEVAATHAFADHHPFTDKDLAPLLERAHDKGATVVTTEKDFVRLPPAVRGALTPVAVNLEWSDAAAFEAFIRDRLGIG